MEIIGFDPDRRPIIAVPIYYDVPSNRLRLSTFIGAARKYEALVAELFDEVFQIDAAFQIYVFPPEPGSFRQKLGVVVIAGLGGILGTGGWDMMDGFLEGLSGLPPREWSQELGKNLREMYKSEYGEDSEVDAETLEAAETTAVLVEVTRQIAGNSNERLIRSGFRPEDLPRVFSAKTDLFYEIESDPQVKGVGFGEEDEAPIRREEFSRYQVRVGKAEDEKDWRFELARYFVSSPNWNRYDTRRKWKGREDGGSTVYFSIIDEVFWEMAAEGTLESHIIDELIAQVAVRYVDGRKVDRVAVNIIRFNDMPISKELRQADLESILSEQTGKGETGSGDLFEE
ncbi:hypothetical protein MWU52_16630 [Jannaschia sp. S6380]|uniref:hypothetical protein n=1 Tax=Jannaschia sp. S6380 TaxID=2926408 RepID=UPI001FF3C83C|nr:hypothetical protein [Jannaschia sp. S6380]MCK0169181.1 hypothetical protein [Jannaschia sp. S6380]